MGTHQLSPPYCILHNQQQESESSHNTANDAVDDVKAPFYDSLNHLLGRGGARGRIILMGDFNAKIRGRNEGYEEVMGKHGVGKINENGEMFVKTRVNNNLVIGGSVFPHTTIHKTT
ncbi:hypothetical protein NHX12_023647, partial [Muraenolepis orangiensis]